MDQNKVALVYYQPIPRLIENVNGHAYYFNPEHSVSLCWAEPEDVDLLLSLKGGYIFCMQDNFYKNSGSKRKQN